MEMLKVQKQQFPDTIKPGDVVNIDVNINVRMPYIPPIVGLVYYVSADRIKVVEVNTANDWDGSDIKYRDILADNVKTIDILLSRF